MDPGDVYFHSGSYTPTHTLTQVLPRSEQIRDYQSTACSWKEFSESGNALIFILFFFSFCLPPSHFDWSGTTAPPPIKTAGAIIRHFRMLTDEDGYLQCQPRVYSRHLRNDFPSLEVAIHLKTLSRHEVALTYLGWRKAFSSFFIYLFFWSYEEICHHSCFPLLPWKPPSAYAHLCACSVGESLQMIEFATIYNASSDPVVKLQPKKKHLFGFLSCFQEN